MPRPGVETKLVCQGYAVYTVHRGKSWSTNGTKKKLRAISVSTRLNSSMPWLSSVMTVRFRCPMSIPGKNGI